MARSDIDTIRKRKTDHLKIALSDISQVGDPGFRNYRFIHNSLPELNFEEIDTSTLFLGKKVNYPFFISCMTGGVAKGKKINRNLAQAAQKYGIAMGVGSQRAAIEHRELEDLFMAREAAPDIPLMANIGIVQLNYGFGLKEFRRCVDMIKADALVVHINPIQEVIQVEGDRNWKGLVAKLQRVVERIGVPVIAKEVGFGLSTTVVRRLYEIGIRIFDTAGWGGTNWALVEGLREKADKRIGELFSGWGIQTVESIKMCADFNRKLILDKKEPITVIGSGGVRSGVDIAKAIALGSDLVGIAAPFAKAALRSTEEVEKLIEEYALGLRISMFGIGVSNIENLKNTKSLERVA
jgi:isopentenyl-diphosphate delta-isomerase